jgi:hypothetical protein
VLLLKGSANFVYKDDATHVEEEKKIILLVLLSEEIQS